MLTGDQKSSGDYAQFGQHLLMNMYDEIDISIAVTHYLFVVYNKLLGKWEKASNSLALATSIFNSLSSKEPNNFTIQFYFNQISLLTALWSSNIDK